MRFVKKGLPITLLFAFLAVCGCGESKDSAVSGPPPAIPITKGEKGGGVGRSAPLPPPPPPNKKG